MTARDRIGDLLIDKGVLDAEDVAAGVAHARTNGMLLGAALKDLGMVDDKLLRAVVEAQGVSRGVTTAERLHAATRMFAAARATVRDVHEVLDRIERQTQGAPWRRPSKT